MGKKEKEELVDLAPRPEKITDEHLKNLQATIGTMDRLTAELGRMDLSKWGLMKSIEKIQKQIDVLRSEFNKEYGTDNINIIDGTIGYPEEQTTLEGNGKANKKD